MKVLLEIRPGEGGSDAKLLVKDQASIYINYAHANHLQCEIVSEEQAALG